MEHVPSVYEVHLEDSKPEELFEVYSKDILNRATTTEVERAMIEYANTLVEPTGWTGVWRSTLFTSGLKTPCDFLVEVLDVSMTELQSRIKIVKVLPISPETIYKKASTLIDTEQMVPLIELHPISEGDEEENFLRTAVAIEYIRFFYHKLWRPWDDDEDFIFAEELLRPRLKFFFDMKNKIIPESMETRAAQILNESWQLRRRLNSLQDSMHASDSEAEVAENELAESLKIRLQLENFQREMEIMENPVVRGLVLKDGRTRSDCQPVNRDYVLTHLVGEKVTLKMIKELSLDEDTVIVIRQYLDEAILSCSDGDTILIYPGMYKCESLSWVEQNITVRGLGAAEDVIIEASTGCGDIFLNVAADQVRLENLTIKPDVGMKATIVAHKGNLHMVSCIVEGSAVSHLLVLSEARTSLVGCQLQNAMEDGIQIRLGATLSMEICKVSNCAGSGIKLEEGSRFDILSTTVKFKDVQCSDNECYGITVETGLYSPDPVLTWEKILCIDWLSVAVENVSCSSNGKGPLGFTPSPVSSPPKEYEKFLDSISHHVQSMSVSSQSCINAPDNSDEPSEVLTLSLTSSNEDCFEKPVINLNKTLTGMK